MQKNNSTLSSGRHITHDIPAPERPQVTTTSGSPDGVAAPPSTRMSVVSNSRLLREGMARLLEAHVEVELVGSYAASTHVPTVLPNPTNHVVLIDGSVDFATLNTWITYWRRLNPPALTIIFELTHDNDLVLACIEAGANGYVLRGASAAEVAQAITLAQQGMAQCTPDITAHIFARLATYRSAGPPAIETQTILTPRELEVLRYIAADCSNQEIADQLVIEVRTVKHHVHNILEKLQLRHRWDAARVAIEQGWLETG